jgi:UDP-glucose 4-epimerase
VNLLITGASGFVGKNLILSTPEHVKVTASYFNDDTFGEFLEQHNLTHVKPLRIDLTRSDHVKEAANSCGEFDACVHLAANGDPAYSEVDPQGDLNANAIGLMNVTSYFTFNKFIYFSSGAVYDGLTGAVNPTVSVSPLLPYAISKWSAEQYLMRAASIGRVNTAIAVRFFGAYGPYEAERKIYGRLVKQFGVEKNPRFTIRGNGQNFIDAMHIEDLIRAILLILEGASQTMRIDLSCGDRMTLETLVRRAATVFDLRPQIEFEGDVPEYIEFYSNDDAMAREFGFTPSICLEEGLRKFHSWMTKT